MALLLSSDQLTSFSSIFYPSDIWFPFFRTCSRHFSFPPTFRMPVDFHLFFQKGPLLQRSREALTREYPLFLVVCPPPATGTGFFVFPCVPCLAPTELFFHFFPLRSAQIALLPMFFPFDTFSIFHNSSSRNIFFFSNSCSVDLSRFPSR